MGIIKKFYITKFKKERPKIELKNISLSFNKRQILDNITCTIREGEICGLLGPNGVGKSTIFNLIIGLLKPDYGSVFIDKKKVNNIPIYKRSSEFKVSIVPQNGGVFSDLTTYQNLNAIADLVIDEKKERLFKIEYMISKFELDAVKLIKAKYLSGGQRKRLSISMALLSNPKIILMDEPTAALGVPEQRKVLELIDTLKKSSIGIIFISHNLNDIFSASDSICVLRQGKKVCEKMISQTNKDEIVSYMVRGEA
mgnify:CR=1 FL=1